MNKLVSNSNKDTKDFALEFSRNLKPGDIVLFYGNLGAGKTTFIQGIAEGLGIKDRIISPTFILLRSHQTSNKTIKNINHIDLYRLEEPSQIESLGLDELLFSSDSVTLIEWADRIRELPNINCYKVFIKSLGENAREIEILKINE